MKRSKFNHRTFLACTFILIIVFAAGLTSVADEIYLDFSNYPQGEARSRGISYWSSSGTDKNPYYEESLRLLYPDSTLQAGFILDRKPRRAELTVTHLSSKLDNCRGDGYSPVTISINGNTLVRNYDVAQNHGGSHGYEKDAWEISRYLHKGNNRIRWVAGNLCTHYWIKKFEIETKLPQPQGEFAGRWVNINPETEGITRLKITSTYRGKVIRAYGQCHPSDCDWGKTKLNLLGDNVSDESPSWAIARWEKGFADTTLILHFSGDILVAQTYTVFKGNSGRSNYRSTYRFRKKWKRNR